MRALVLVLDSLGIGAAPDAERFGDQGSNTFGHIAEHCAAGRCEGEAGRSGPLRVPHLERLGIGLASELAGGALPAGMSSAPAVLGAYGAARECSSGKDTPSGHWEMAGVPVRFDWGYFSEREASFPPALLDAIVRRGGLPGYLGNCHASGTDIIASLGAEHIATGKPILYTSADSVFQIACHEGSFGLERLYRLCEIAREEVDAYNICRVIARPFVGDAPDNFARTGNRRDLAVPPPAPTVLDKLARAGGQVIAIGKISDIYAGMGVTRKIKANGLDGLWDATLAAAREAPDFSLVMTNFVDFDQNFGHRRKVAGYAAALEYFDSRLPDLYPLLREDDVLILSADHGCDPTWPGTDHTREHVPVLVYGKQVAPGSLGVRDSFADIGQSLASWFGLDAFEDGKSFLAAPRAAGATAR
ncbi:phosphopentomutase [Burkholderia gladioli]|uniref:phosphopentomutase n=1 Tax=Burkholderia gladioli TaxID=28095 RepID=UPI000BBCFE37|nr:phosphopentomutase [Burkholderia gladioli]ATF87995.1 phosphopentomutase [Burkholderia gladioli pv. gladioli]MBJ9713671.1 phosphopentomutase [Burkholderia gladioli]MBU9156943.1 phosphopentomutase [Burkholderia gladioli]MCH7268798.1 phosphopentomutase [Burkholderia gladioli]MDR8086274.1 phosphopentomutase [Burkholderia gladioli]